MAAELNAAQPEGQCPPRSERCHEVPFPISLRRLGPNMRVPSFSNVEHFILRLILLILLILAGFRLVRDDMRHTFSGSSAVHHAPGPAPP